MAKRHNHTFAGLNMTGVATLAEAVTKFNMDFSAMLVPATYTDLEGDEQVNPDKMTVLRSDSGGYLGTVGMRYTTADYVLAFGPAQELIQSGATIVGGGCPNRGERAYLVLEAPGVVNLSRGDDIVNRFIMLSSHDGTGKIEVRMAPWRKKTGTAITFDAGHPLAFKHTRNVRNRVQKARKVFNSVNNSWAEFSTGIQKMIACPVTTAQAREFVESVLPASGDSDDPSTRMGNIHDDILNIYNNTGIGTRLPKCRGTLFGLVQAFTEWADIKRTVRSSSKRDEVSAGLDARLVSDSAKKKSKAWAMALYLANNKSMHNVFNPKGAK